MLNVLMIDDEPKLCEAFTRLIAKLGHRVRYVSSGKEALAMDEKTLSEFEVALIDMNMVEMDGYETGIQLKKSVPHIVTIMLTADDRVETVVKALRDSQFDDYLSKQEVAKDAMSGSPRLQETLLRAEGILKTRKELEETQKALSQEHELSSLLRSQSVEINRELIGESDAFKTVITYVQQVAPSDSTVLIIGETGTGKEMIAREVHRRSLRSAKPFVAINCGAIPRDLLESELFGHEKGAFTGATNQRDGFFKMANQGTLFLDEIGDMPMELQVKLLRVLQEKEIIPLGGHAAISVDVRVITATHRNLKDHIEAGQFRSDLFYRLNVFPIMIPPFSPH